MREEEIVQKISTIRDETSTRGDYEGALNSLRTLEGENPESLMIKFNKIGLLIDIGSGLKRPQIIEEGLVDVEELLENPLFRDYKINIHYYAANGYSALFSIAYTINRNIIQLVENEDLQKAKRHFREALKSAENVEPELRKQIWTNYGNCLDSLGRTIEALDAYEEALKIDPDFSMALGNKAIALRFFANISGEHRKAIYIKSYQILKTIENEDSVRFGGVTARESFENEIRIIESLFEDKSILYQNLENPPYDITNATDFEKFYIDFCSKHKLFLNFHIHEDNCEASIVDPIFITLITPVGDTDTYDNLAKYINQIKEDYIVARLLLVQSQFKREDFNHISRRTTFVNTLDYGMFNIYIGLLKSAFKEAYNILDKISRFIKEYYKLDVHGDIYFTTIWQGKNNKNARKIRPEIVNSKNISLYALYDIFLDFKYGYYKRIKDIRNASVHERLVIYDSVLTNWDKKEDKYNIGYDAMLSQTIKLLQLVKSSIIYLMNFVQLEENKKKDASKGLIPSIYADTTQFL